MSDKLRVAVIGMGWFGRLHLDAWRQVATASVVAICDLDLRALDLQGTNAQDAFHVTAEGSRELYGEDVERHASVEELLQKSDFDVLDIVTPEYEHYEIALKALRAGKSVIIEKPFVTDSGHARSLIAEAALSGKHIYVGNVLRFDVRYQYTLEDLHGRGEPVRYIGLQRHFQRSALDVYGRVHPFFGACIHDIDTAIWVHGRKPLRVLGTVTIAPDSQRQDAAVGLMQWPDESMAVIQNTWHLPISCPSGFNFEVSISTSKRAYSIRSFPVVEVQSDESYRLPEFFFWPKISDIRGGALVSELQHYAQCAIENIGSTRMPVNQALWGVEIAEALIKSSLTGEWVSL